MQRFSRTDPSGQKLNRRRSATKIIRRLQKAQREVITVVRKIERIRITQKAIVNENIVIYQYDMTGEDYERLQLAIQSILDEELETASAAMPAAWWYRKEIELPYRQGTLEELRDINQQVSVVTRGSPLVGEIPRELPASRVLMSPRYLDGLRQAQVRNYDLIKTLSRDTAKQVYVAIESDIQAGRGLLHITENLKERFGVSHSSAKRIAATEVNRAYNDARLNTVKRANEETGLNFAVLHISSLLPSTRPNHAARHGNAYTPEQQLRWWNEDVNRINCHCTTRTVVIEDGKVLQSELQKKVKDMRNES